MLTSPKLYFFKEKSRQFSHYCFCACFWIHAKEDSYTNILFDEKQTHVEAKFAWKGIFASILIRFACKIRWFASMQYKPINPVSFFASKRINICYIFAYMRFEPNVTAHPSYHNSSKEHQIIWVDAYVSWYLLCECCLDVLEQNWWIFVRQKSRTGTLLQQIESAVRTLTDCPQKWHGQFQITSKQPIDSWAEPEPVFGNV